MKFKLTLSITVLFFAATAQAGIYRCDVELTDGNKTVLRGIVADSESQAARIAKESNNSIKWINCFRIN